MSMIATVRVDPARAGEDDFRQPAIQALRVAGADATQLVEPVITYLFEGSGVEPLRADSEGTVAVTRPGDQYNAQWSSVVYPQGDTLWVVTAAEPVRTELLAALRGRRSRRRSRRRHRRRRRTSRPPRDISRACCLPPSASS